MRASIIIVSYNSRKYLASCLDAVLAQLTPHDEIIVVDNGSTDGSPELVQTLGTQLRLLQNTNQGYAGGNNRGAEVALGDYLVFLNPDTLLAVGALEALLAPLAGQTNIGLTTGCVVYAQQPNIVNACGNVMHFTGLTYCRGAGDPRSEHAISGEVDAVSGAAFATRRSVFAKLGGFDEQFFMYVEDTDLSLRYRLSGYRCWYAADAVVQHDYEMSYTPRKAFYLDRNRHLMLLKNLRATTYLRLMPGLALGEVITWGFLLLKGPRYWGIKLRVYGWLWAYRQDIQTAYRDVQWQRWDDREIVRTMTYQLDFRQLANRYVARFAELVFHPAFRVTQFLITIGRN